MERTNGRTNGNIRVGFYICHCGSNIAATINVEEVAEYISRMPGVALSRTYKYMCSDPGQEMIVDDIRKHQLNRIVVSACSPLLHEKTFRNAVIRAGLNPFYFHMVNIREHASWVHSDPIEATEKAKDLARAAVARVAYHRELEKRRVPVHPDILIVGGGIAGITAALNLANAGKKVYLVEKETTIGGHMAMFDKTFPTLDCAACILTPKMSAVREHPNITLWAYSEVAKVDGYVGNFDVEVRRKPRYVDEDICVGCLECIDACTYKKPTFASGFFRKEDIMRESSPGISHVEGLGLKSARGLSEAQLAMDKRKPIDMPFPQSVPPVVTIDPNLCLHFKTGKCDKPCEQSCERRAINFDQPERIEKIHVGTIIVATGFKTFDPHRLPQYGYGRYKNVYTSLEVERLVNSSGPTAGEVVLRDGKRPKSIGIIHCVGSRDHKTNKWCSRVCCMYSLKLAHLLKEHSEGAEIYNFYIDMRCPGKGYEEFYDRTLEEGVQFVRGRVAEVTDWAMEKEEEDKLVVRVEDTLAGFVRRIPVDMVVLSVGLEPGTDADDVRRMFNISCSTEGWFLEKHPKLAPVETASDGIYIAGCCQGPKDIPDTVAQAGAAAAEALSLINRGFVEIEPNTAYISEDECSGCKSCIGLCPYTAISFNADKDVAEINEALCKGCGTCVAACPSGSIAQNMFEDDQIFSEIQEVLAGVH